MGDSGLLESFWNQMRKSGIKMRYGFLKSYEHRKVLKLCEHVGLVDRIPWNEFKTHISNVTPVTLKCHKNVIFAKYYPICLKLSEYVAIVPSSAPTKLWKNMTMFSCTYHALAMHLSYTIQKWNQSETRISEELWLSGSVTIGPGL